MANNSRRGELNNNNNKNVAVEHNYKDHFVPC